MYVCLPICLYVCKWIFTGVCVSMCNCACSCMRVFLFVYLSICLSVCLFVCLTVYLSFCLSLCLSVCMFVCLSVCMCVKSYLSPSHAYRDIKEFRRGSGHCLIPIVSGNCNNCRNHVTGYRNTCGTFLSFVFSGPSALFRVGTIPL